MEINETIFISYAWGGPFQAKEWIRDHVTMDLRTLDIPVFWDRDDIKPGQSIDAQLRHALAARPINVICICDKDYISAASRPGSGLARELAILSSISDDERVRITPVVIDDLQSSDLPFPLSDRVSVSLVELRQKDIYLSPFIYLIAAGASQAEITFAISDALAIHDLHSRAKLYTDNPEFRVEGCASSHEVFLADGTLLLPPAWMMDAIEWKYRMVEEVSGFCPSKGVWHWDHWSPSTGMHALGIAICAALFHDKQTSKYMGAITQCGAIVAEGIISLTRKNEPLQTNGREIVQILVRNIRSRSSLERLLLDCPE